MEVRAMVRGDIAELPRKHPSRVYTCIIILRCGALLRLIFLCFGVFCRLSSLCVPVPVIRMADASRASRRRWLPARYLLPYPPRRSAAVRAAEVFAACAAPAVFLWVLFLFARRRHWLAWARLAPPAAVTAPSAAAAAPAAAVAPAAPPTLPRSAPSSRAPIASPAPSLQPHLR
jgi:hypothetical protein